MTFPVILCWAANHLGFESEINEMTSPTGTLKITVCERCATYHLESHGLSFGGKFKNALMEFPMIAEILGLAGCETASRELKTLTEAIGSDTE